MNTDRGVLAFAGAVVLVSLALGRYVSPYWCALTAFVGADLIQASVTGFSPMAYVLRKLGARAGTAFR